MNEICKLVDFHAHILPCADHGSASIETTLFQLASAKKCGVERIIATPHFYPHIHTVDEFVARRDLAYAEMVSRADSSPLVRLGAEALICNGIENLPGLERLFVSGTNVLLLELPFNDFQREYVSSVYEMIKSGVEVVLAHAERYPSENIEQMIGVGAKIQLNAIAFRSAYKKKPYYKWLCDGVVVALGSDIHGMDKNAYPDFKKACSRLGELLIPIVEFSEKIWI